MLPVVETQSPNHWTAREVPHHRVLSLNLVLFLLSHSERSLRELQEAQENSRSLQSLWEPGPLGPPPLAAPSPLCDPVEAASISVP